jgi:hypothetical protein
MLAAEAWRPQPIRSREKVENVTNACVLCIICRQGARRTWAQKERKSMSNFEEPDVTADVLRKRPGFVPEDLRIMFRLAQRANRAADPMR